MDLVDSRRAEWTFLVKNCYKVEKILKGSLDSIPSRSPSVKIQIIVDITQQCFASSKLSHQ